VAETDTSVADDWSTWQPRLRELCDEIRRRTRRVLLDALAAGDARAIDRPAGQGAGDLTFGLDLPSERSILEWARRWGARAPLSVMTEDAGWRHLGPGGRPAPDGGDGRPRELPDFDHGGPRIAFDPVDGTRNLMADLRSAWTVVSFAGAGSSAPTLEELSGGMLSEIPPSRVERPRLFHAHRGQGSLTLEDGERSRRLRVDDDDRVDHGYFPIFRYEPARRPAIASLEAEFFRRIAEAEGADLRSVYDDQYISNGGHLVQLVLGTYRMIVDPRALVGERAGRPTVTSKPYDVAGAILCAREAGAVVRAADGGELDFPIDTETPVHFAGWANEATRARLERHWLATLEAVL